MNDSIADSVIEAWIKDIVKDFRAHFEPIVQYCIGKYKDKDERMRCTVKYFEEVVTFVLAIRGFPREVALAIAQMIIKRIERNLETILE